MRLLYAAVTLPVKLSLEIARAVGLVRDDEGEEVAVQVPPQPNFFRPRPQPAPSPVNGGTPPAVGAEVHVDEPWPGYGEMRAADIASRLRTEPAEVAAAVSLYEAAGKGRSSVLEAAARKVR